MHRQGIASNASKSSSISCFGLSFRTERGPGQLPLENHERVIREEVHRETGETDEIDEPRQIWRQAGRATSSEWRAERKPAILPTA
jgi:hypothetical protein